MKIWYYFVICALLFVITSGCAQEAKSQAKLKQPEEIPGSQKELEEAPDEMLSSFSLTGYAEGGKKQWDLEGKSADIQPEEINLLDVTGKVYGKQTDMTIVADEGSLNRIDNSMHLEKNVKATTDDGVTMATDYLDWDAQNEKLSSEAAVRIERGMMEAEGTGFIARPTLNMVELKKDVTVTLSLQEQDSLSLDVSAAPTVITCTGPLEVEYENNLAIFRDNVKVKDERGEIFADKMDVYFAPEAEEARQIEGMEGIGIEKIVAVGDVEIHHGGNITYSQKAVYDTHSGKLILTGQPKLVIYSTESLSQLTETE